MIYIKLHQTDKGVIIAMCDEKLIGKVLKDKYLEMDIKKYSDFYKGDLVKPEDAEGIIKDSSFYSANIVGDESVKTFENAKGIGAGSIRKIGNVSFLQVFNLL